MRPARIDAIIDFAYGGLILLAVVLIATLDIRVGLTFGLGSSPRTSSTSSGRWPGSIPTG